MSMRVLVFAGSRSQLLQDENPKNMVNYDEIMESTDKIEKHVQRAKGITQRMLGFGRRMNPGRSEIMVNVLVDQATEFLKTEARGRNITIEKDFSADVPVILSDSAQLEQVFINIIDNAIDAIGKNGSIAVRTEPWEDGARIYFKDTGPGMRTSMTTTWNMVSGCFMASVTISSALCPSGAVTMVMPRRDRRFSISCRNSTSSSTKSACMAFS